MITFELSPRNNMILPFFSISLDYPFNDLQYLEVELDVKADLLQTELTLTVFEELLQILKRKKYYVNSAFVHYYRGNAKRTLLSGVICTFLNVNEYRILDHSIDYRFNWKNKLMDVFYMNCIIREAISVSALKQIKKIVGNENVIEHSGQILFKLPQSPTGYLINKFISTRSRNAIKNILEEEKICSKDLSFLLAILKW